MQHPAKSGYAMASPYGEVVPLPLPQIQCAYELLCQSGCLTLPSQHTLRDYTHHVKSDVGFSTEVDLIISLLMQLSWNLARSFRNMLCFSLMYVLVYRKNSGTLIGFVNMGNIYTHLLAFDTLWRRLPHWSLDLN